MVQAQVGNAHGLTAISPRTGGSLLGAVTADGINTVTVAAADLPKLSAGMVIDIATRSTGAIVASARTITNITSAGVVTYDGADVAATVNDGVYPTGKVSPSGRSNLNGGISANEGLDLDNLDTIAAMRTRLQAISATTYSDTELNKMTMNDLAYAIRVNDAPGTIKQ